MANKCLVMCSTSLPIWEIQMKTTWRFSYSDRMASSANAGEGEPLLAADGTVNGTVTCKSLWRLLKN